MIEDYIKFVEKTIENHKKIGDLIRNDEIHPRELNTALGYYFNSNLALNAEYQRAKIEQAELEISFEEWWDKKFEEAKTQVRNEYEEGKGSIKPAVKEFDTRTRSNNRVEYTSWKRKLTTAEAKTRFLLRLLETFKKYDSILVTLSNNMRTEMRTLSLEDRMNKDGTENKIRSQFPIKS